MITTDRNIFIGAHVTAPVKAALQTASQRQKKSMSLIVFEALQAYLTPKETAK